MLISVCGVSTLRVIRFQMTGSLKGIFVDELTVRNSAT